MGSVLSLVTPAALSPMLHLFFDLSAFAPAPQSGEAPVVDADGGKPPPEWVHILPAPDKDGLIYSRDFRIVEVDDLEKLAARSNAAIKRQKGGQPVDADHELYGWWSSGGPVKAWAEEFEARKDGLYARVDWLKAGADLVSSRQYRYTSSVIDGPGKWQLDEDGWPETLTITAEAIVGFGITNVPALETHSMFNTAKAQDLKTIETLRVMACKLGIPDDATPDQIKAAFHRFTSAAPADAGEQAEATAEDQGEAAEAPPPETQSTAGDDTPATDSAPAPAEVIDEAEVKLRRALGLDQSAPRSQVFAAAADRIDALEAEQAETLIETLSRDGKLAPAQRTAALDLARKQGGVATIRSLYANAPAIVRPDAAPPTRNVVATHNTPPGVSPIAFRAAREGKSIPDIVRELQQHQES